MGMNIHTRKTERRKHDWYPTPRALADYVCMQLRDRLGWDPSHVTEPGCGDGTFMEAIQAAWPHATVQGFDINPTALNHAKAKGLDVDISSVDDWSSKRPGVAIGNPPFNLVQTFVQQALKNTDAFAYIVRIGFISSKNASTISFDTTRHDMSSS